jgi:catechol 2,3-dioxygenase
VSLPDALTLGPVHLTVADLERSIPYYERAVGLRVHRGEDGTAALGAGDADLVVLVEERAARTSGRTAGLFHLALLHDSRAELAHAVLRIATTGTPVAGASDHGVSEAIYLRDPDGNGIELYADRPRGEWPAPASPRDRIGMYTIPLDVHALLAVVDGEDPRPHAGRGLRMGHVHLQVGDLAAAARFHVEVLGFERMVGVPGAEFLAAGGYHHHLAVNAWLGEGLPPAPESGAGLRHWTVVLPDGGAVGEVRARVEGAGAPLADHPSGFLARDPAGIAVAVVAA